MKGYRREPLTQDDANRLAQACTAHDERLVVWTLLDCGLRVGELAGLSKENIDWQGHRLIVYGKGGPHGKRSKRRVVPMSARVYALIEHHFAIYEHVGPRLSAGPISAAALTKWIQRLVKAVANRAHVSRPVTPHVLRHTFAVTALQRGLSLAAIQRILGHDHLSTTAIYLNLSPEEAIREYREKW